MRLRDVPLTTQVPLLSHAQPPDRHLSVRLWRCQALGHATMPSAHRQDSGWEPLFWSVFERSKNAIALIDERRVNIEVNEAMCELLGASRDALVGTQIDRWQVPEEISSLDAEWRELLQSGEVHGERGGTRADGSRIRAQYAARVMEVDGQRLVLLVVLGVKSADETSERSRVGELTERQREIVGLVALGHTSAEIGVQLGISTETARTHVRNAMSKTGTKTRAQLVAMALADRRVIGSPDVFRKAPE